MKCPLVLLVLAVSGFSCLCAPAWSAAHPAERSASTAQPGPVAGSSSALAYPATATIPGPLRSFLRMAAISQKVSPDEVLPLLARNVSVQGYQDGKPTEFLVLLRRYMDQARELVVLAGSEGIIRVSSCNEGRPLLAILEPEISPATQTSSNSSPSRVRIRALISATVNVLRTGPQAKASCSI